MSNSNNLTAEQEKKPRKPTFKQQWVLSFQSNNPELQLYTGHLMQSSFAVFYNESEMKPFLARMETAGWLIQSDPHFFYHLTEKARAWLKTNKKVPSDFYKEWMAKIKNPQNP